jgi:hypothetical protein
LVFHSVERKAWISNDRSVADSKPDEKINAEGAERRRRIAEGAFG